jgi:predicted GH43/DUF377 family glycosyl hydrolase
MARFRPAALFPLRTIACAASAVAVLVSCSGSGGGSASGTASPTLDASKIAAACFQGGTTPELQIGSGFTGADWNDPHVLKVGGEYWMYASSNQGFAPTPPSPVQIYRFTSTDAASWTLNPPTPVLTVKTGDWDEGGDETPAVVSFGGKYHMFWTGYPDAWPNLNAFNFKIGHAISTDGIVWAKDTAPLLSSSGAADFMQYIVGEPGPVVFNNTLYLYFTAVGVDAGLAAGLQTVGVMTSADGIAWSAPAQAFKPDQSVYPRASNWVGYSTPNAVVIEGKVHVFVDVANDGSGKWTQVALHHAYSSDGLTGWTQDTAPIRRLTDFTWTAREIRSPAAFLDGTTLRLYFAGDDLFNTGAWGIVQMTCELVP